MAGEVLRFALDQNFPPLLPGALPLLPEVEVLPIHKIDHRMSDLGDRELVIALHQLGWNGLITNNYKMLYQPTEIAAILKTKLVIFAVQGVGDDPVRATGSVLLDLPGAIKRASEQCHVFLVHPRNPTPREGWEFFKDAATRRKRNPGELYREVCITDDELKTPVLA